LTAAGAAAGAQPADGGSPRARELPLDPLAPIVFVLLVLACVAAFFITQHLKHTPTAVQRFERTPNFDPASATPEDRQEHISFKLAQADDVTVTVVDANLNVVATLLRDYPVPRYKQLSVRWNGRRGTASRIEGLVSPTGHRSLVPVTTGASAPPGEYRVRVDLARQGREVLSPWSFTLAGGGR
jgi:hypothetical protein